MSDVRRPTSDVDVRVDERPFKGSAERPFGRVADCVDRFTSIKNSQVYGSAVNGALDMWLVQCPVSQADLYLE